jgi:hypothetical protein
MVLKSNLEEKLNELNKLEKDYEEYDENYKDNVVAINILSTITAGFAISAVALYATYDQQIAQEYFSLPKFAFQFCSGIAGGVGTLNLIFLGLCGMDYLELKDLKKKRDNLRIESENMKEDYKFSRGYN